MARVYATIDPGALGPAMEIERGGLIVTSNATSLDMHRCARGRVAALAGKYFYEAAFYGEGALLDQASIGIVRSTHSLAKFVGELSTGFGLIVGSGGIYSNNVELAATDDVAKETYIGVLVDMGALTCTWFVNGSPVGSVSIASARWYPAVTVSAQAAYDLRCYINFGQYAFERPVRTNYADNSGPYLQGWYSDFAEPEQLRFGPKRARAFHTRASDTLPLVSFDPRITNADQFTYARRATVWTQGKSGSSSSFGSIEIDNQDGRYDDVAGQDRRDQIATIVAVPAGGAYDDGEVVATAVVDRVEAVGESAIRFTLKDGIVTLKRALQLRRFAPWADDGVAFTTLPIALGALRNVNPPLEDAVNRIYRLGDGAVTNIVAVRDKGALLDPNSSPPQYVPALDAQGLQLQTNAVGLLTVDMSSEGDQIIIPGAADVLAGAGELTAWPNPALAPTGWAWSAGSGNTLTRLGTAQSMPQNYVASMSTGDAFNPGIGESGAYLRYDTAVLEPGRTYRVQFRLVRTSGPASPVIGGIQFGLMVRSDLTDSPTGAISPHMLPLQAPQFGTTGQAYTFTYTVPPGAARKIWFIVSASRDNTGSGYGLATALWYGLKVELLGQIPATQPLIGIGLFDYWREIFARAGIDDDEWVPEDAQQIDSDTKYTFGVYLDGEPTVEDALRLPLDSYCATMFTDQLNRKRVRRLIDPSTVSDSDVVLWLTESDIKYGITVRQDLAPGLTTQMGARPNWRVYGDADFVTDDVAVPPALRTQFKRESQFIEPASATLSPSYRAAMQAPPLRSLFDDPDMAATEIQRVNAFYAAGRIRSSDGRAITTTPRLIELTIAYSGVAPPNLLFVDVIHVTYPRYGLQGGQKLAVFDVIPGPYPKTMTIIAWGTE
jgi:hypothetical protein